MYGFELDNYLQLVLCTMPFNSADLKPTLKTPLTLAFDACTHALALELTARLGLHQDPCRESRRVDVSFPRKFPGSPEWIQR